MPIVLFIAKEVMSLDCWNVAFSSLDEEAFLRIDEVYWNQ